MPLSDRHSGRRVGYGVGVLTGPRSWLGSLGCLLLGKSRREVGYIVNAKVAVDLLGTVAPEAAEWWRQHTPHLLDGRHHLIFDEACCEVVDVEP